MLPYSLEWTPRAPISKSIFKKGTHLKGCLIKEDGHFKIDRKGNDKKDYQAKFFHDW